MKAGDKVRFKRPDETQNGICEEDIRLLSEQPFLTLKELAEKTIVWYSEESRNHLFRLEECERLTGHDFIFWDEQFELVYTIEPYELPQELFEL